MGSARVTSIAEKTGENWLLRVSQTNNHMKSAEKLTNFTIQNSIKILADEVRRSAEEQAAIQLRDESKQKAAIIENTKIVDACRVKFKSFKLSVTDKADKIAHFMKNKEKNEECYLENFTELRSMQAKLRSARLNSYVDDHINQPRIKHSDKRKLMAKFNRQVKICARDMLQYDMNIVQVILVKL